MIYQFEDFSLDTDRRELRRADAVIEVEPQVFALLELLVSNPNRMIPKDEIIDEVWNGRIVSDGSLNSRVLSLRKALGDDGQQQRLIKTVRGQGFRFVGTLDPSVEATMSPEKTAAPPATASMSSETAARTRAPVVAVLPFDNMSSNPDQDHLADGICEDILTVLSKISGMEVIARNSSFAYRGKAIDLRQIGKELGASHILEGSVRRAGDQLRVTGQLIDTQTGLHLWAERYDRTLDDIFAIQDDMTRHIVSALQVTLVEGDMAGLWAGGTKSFDAWSYQVQALPLIRTMMPENIRKGREMSRKAAAVDPSFAVAWTTIVASLLGESLAGWGEDFQTNLPEVVAAYERALEIDDSNPLVLAWTGVANIYAGHHEVGLSRAKQAVELDPNNPNIVFGLFFAKVFCETYSEPIHPQFASVANGAPHFLTLGAVNCLVTDRPEQALKLAKMNLDLAPKYLWAHALAAACYAAMGEMAEATNQIESLLEKNPAYSLSHFAGTVPFREAARSQKLIALVKRAGLS